MWRRRNQYTGKFYSNRWLALCGFSQVLEKIPSKGSVLELLFHGARLYTRLGVDVGVLTVCGIAFLPYRAMKKQTATSHCRGGASAMPRLSVLFHLLVPSLSPLSCTEGDFVTFISKSLFGFPLLPFKKLFHYILKGLSSYFSFICLQ